MDSLRGKTLLVTGGSRGIGLAIALRVAREGANVALLAKTVRPHPSLPGTLFTAAAEIEAAGGQALPLECDVRNEEQVVASVQRTVDTFGGVDICVNNASAISLTGALETPMKKYDLMHQVNARGTFLVSQACLPHLVRARGHLLMLSPPLTLEPRWFGPHVAYSMAKYGMSLCVLGLAEEFRGQVAVNALWPRTTIATAAVDMLGGEALMKASRKPEIMADAARAIFAKDASFTGNFCLDEDVLRGAGVTDFAAYAMDPSVEPTPDFFLPTA